MMRDIFRQRDWAGAFFVVAFAFYVFMAICGAVLVVAVLCGLVN